MKLIIYHDNLTDIYSHLLLFIYCRCTA